ncbi:RNA exonuclease 1 homolog [Rhinophrynus dorsalis]
MLKSTGYFRGIECPFRECCRRPYCHFRHRGRAVGSVVAGEARIGAEYDPYSPDFSNVPHSLDNGISGAVPEPSLDILELERVNKAIEAVKSEVEREQRKYEELLETQKDYKTSPSKSAQNVSSSLEYDPGSYLSCGADYNPTPLTQGKGMCKYTLDDSDVGKSKGRFMEYVPTTVTPVPKYKTSKYVIDNSKPHTDMEYDPMSNYSARLLSKAKQQKGTKRSRQTSKDDCYSPLVKKTCSRTTETLVDARFSDSEEEIVSKYVPTESKILPSRTKDDVSFTEKSVDKDRSSQELKEMAVQYDMEDIEHPVTCHIKDQHKKIVKASVSKTEKKEESKKSSKSSESSKNGSCKEMRKEKSKHVKPKSEQVNVKNEENKGVVLKPKSGSMKTGGVKSNKPNSEKDPGKTLSCKSKKEQVERKPSKDNMGNGKKNTKEEVKNGKFKERMEKSGSREKSKVSASGSVKTKSKQRSLSHVDLFGDESSEEELEKNPSPSVILGSCGGGNNSAKGNRKGTSQRPSTSSVESVEIDYSLLEKEVDSDSDPMEECLRVFNESTDVKTEDKGRMGKQPHENNEEKSENTMATLLPGQKRRISHVNNPTSSDTPNKPVIRPYRRPTPQEICYQRIQRAQEQAGQLLAQQPAVQHTSSAQQASPSQPGEKKRIARVPGSLPSSTCQLLSPDVKKSSVDTTPAYNGLSSALKTRTLSGMSSKTTATTVQKRKAHVPSLQSVVLKRPIIPTEFGAKVPTTVRQRYLNLFIDECLKFCPSQQEAFDKALSEEQVVYNRSTSRNIYLNVAVNTLKKLRNQGPSEKTTPKSINKKAVSHESVLGGKLAAKTSYSVQRNSGHREDTFTDATLYAKLKEYILTPEQMQENGYPMPHPDKPGKALLSSTDDKKNTDSSCRVCCRCGTEYMVSPSGNCVRREECIYHWGRLRRQRVPGGWETHYSCCSGVVGSTGCQAGKQHVYDGRKENLDGFVKTFEKLPAVDANPGVYALDCEMCYTTQGLELTRVTVINSQLKVVYDTFVQPDNKIVDYNTRFSGVTEEDLKNTSITMRDVQAVLLCMFSSDTILIGHSLESDLFALKLIHPTVVDTAIVFPHRLGLPYKRALRSLMADHLKRIIQDSVEGHDSSEDACSCMELMIWKIKEDAKVKR